MNPAPTVTHLAAAGRPLDWLDTTFASTTSRATAPMIAPTDPSRTIGGGYGPAVLARRPERLRRIAEHLPGPAAHAARRHAASIELQVARHERRHPIATSSPRSFVPVAARHVPSFAIRSE